jgi:signal transduction histidine kinase
MRISLFEVKCRFLCENAPEWVENGIALHLYYIVQEAIANAAKHGKASHVQPKLERCNDRFGAGFAPDAGRHAGVGLRIIYYRARVIGATLEVKSQPGHSTQVTCVFLPGVRDLPAMSNHRHEIVSK